MQKIDNLPPRAMSDRVVNGIQVAGTRHENDYIRDLLYVKGRWQSSCAVLRPLEAYAARVLFLFTVNYARFKLTGYTRM